MGRWAPPGTDKCDMEPYCSGAATATILENNKPLRFYNPYVCRHSRMEPPRPRFLTLKHRTRQFGAPAREAFCRGCDPIL